MSWRYWLEVTVDGAPIDCCAERGVVSLTVQIRPGAQSQAVLSLDPTVDDPVPIDGDDWRIYLVLQTPDEEPTRHLLMRGALVRAAHYEEAFEEPQGGQGGGLRQLRQAIIRDKHASFKEDGPSELVTHKASDTYAELQFVADQLGLTAVLPSLQPVTIDRIDYTRESGWWSPLSQYFAPYAPLDFIDPDSDSLRLVDTTELDGSAPHGGVLTAAEHYNPLTSDVDLGDPVTQAKVTYVLYGPGSGPSQSPVDIRRFPNVSTDDDGSTRVVTTITGFLHEDPDDPALVTRTVDIGEEITVTGPNGQALEHQSTTHERENDYTKLVKSTMTHSILCDLPGIPVELFREIETIVTTYKYEDDPEKPGRELLVEMKRTTNGLFFYTETSAGYAEDKKRGTPVRRGAHSFNVDTASTSSQRWADDLLNVRTENYRRAPGAREVHEFGEEIDKLRGRVLDSWNHMVPGDNQIAIEGRTKSEYVGTGPRRAIQIDASKIGRELGLELAERLISRTEPTVTMGLTLLRPDYTKYRLGSMVMLDDDAPRGLSGSYLCRSVTFSGRFPAGSEPNVSQTIELFKSW